MAMAAMQITAVAWNQTQELRSWGRIRHNAKAQTAGITRVQTAVYNMAKAMKYVRKQWRELRQFLREGLVPIDNNEVERAIRPIAIGRKNWLFAGSMRGGRAAAVIYTLVESCKRAQVDVLAYLADVLVRVATHPANKIDELLPANWAIRFAPPTCATA